MDDPCRSCKLTRSWSLQAATQRRLIPCKLSNRPWRLISRSQLALEYTKLFMRRLAHGDLALAAEDWRAMVVNRDGVRVQRGELAGHEKEEMWLMEGELPVACTGLYRKLAWHKLARECREIELQPGAARRLPMEDIARLRGAVHVKRGAAVAREGTAEVELVVVAPEHVSFKVTSRPYSCTPCGGSLLQL